MKYDEQLKTILKELRFNDNEIEEFINIILPIFSHYEFQKRMDYTKYPHHNLTSLGTHMLFVAIFSYKYICKYNKKVDKKTTILIAMFHDLYEYPWQNNKIHKSVIVNKHGFTHPIEACINAYTYFKEYFQNEEQAKIIIDGIIHHMYPFPVRSLDKLDAELNNYEKFNKLPNNIKKLIIESTNRHKLIHISLCKSKYKEGRIVSNMDKKTTFIQDKVGIKGFLSFITGKNKKLIEIKKDR